MNPSAAHDSPIDGSLVKYVEGLRRTVFRRRRDAIIAALTALVILCALIWFAFVVPDLFTEVESVKLEQVTIEGLHALVWHLYGISALRDILVFKGIFWIALFAMTIYTALNRLFVRREELIVALWDRIAALEADVRTLREQDARTDSAT